QRVSAQLNSIVDLKKEQINVWLDDRKADARLLADNFLIEEHFTEILDPRTDPQRRAAFSGFLIDNLRGVQKARTGYREIMFVDLGGKVILSTDSTHIGANWSAHPAIAMTFASPNSEYIYDIHHEEDSDTPEMTFGHVIHAVDLKTDKVLPNVNGAVIIRVRMDETLYPLISNWPDKGKTGETLLVRNATADTLFLNPLRFNDNASLTLHISKTSPHAQPSHLAAAGQEGIIQTLDYRGVPVLAAYRAIPQMKWGFEVEMTTDNRRTDEIGQLAKSFQSMIAAVRDRESQLQSHAKELELLNQLGRDIAATLDLRTISTHVVTHVAERFNGFLCGLLLYDESSEELVAYSAAGHGANRIALGDRTPLGHGLMGQAALTRQTQLVNDAAAQPDFVPLAGLDIRAEVTIPILREEKLLGVLVVSSDHVNAFHRDDVLLLETLAAQLAPAVENARLFRDLSASNDYTLDALAAALDARDKETEGHSRRVVAYTLAIARRMNLTQQELDTIRRGALLHDIGKIGVPDAILLKAGPLTEEERAVMRRHPEWGQRILSGIPFLDVAAEIVCTHQERWDGGGYPRQLKGEAIPLGARVFAVADTYDAITSDRPYRAGRSYSIARAEIEAGSGTQFDPRAVEIFLQIPELEFMRLRAEALTSPAVTQPLPLWAELPVSSTSSVELEALNSLIKAVSGSLNLDEILREAACTTVETLGAAACGLFLYEAETDILTLAAAYGFPESLKDRFSRFPVSGFHNEVVVREACIRLHDDIAEVPAFVELGLLKSQPEWGAYLCVPLTAKGEVSGIMGVLSRRPRAFESHDITLYQAMGEQIGLAIANARLYQTTQQQAMTDSLTGAYNRRHFDEFLPKEIERCNRYRHGVSLIMLDMDRFKEYNDAYGHPAGDEVLRQVVRLILKNVRGVDVVARYGGEEFAVVLPETDLAGACIAAEKIRAVVDTHRFPKGRLTVSLGVAHCSLDSESSPDVLLARADQALYKAKNNGRNCVCVWQPEFGSVTRQTP
ncbi:MAG: diguanylate cyclase, partial [Chloroflexi bacterium]|nr:diguanylate cyclase [Chloroflexota bacterium]